MHSDDGYSALDALRSISELRGRLGRLERRALGTPWTDKPAGHDDLEVIYLKKKLEEAHEKAEKSDNFIQNLYKRIDEANETAEQFKRAAERFKKDFWAERDVSNQSLKELENERQAGAEAGAEMAKLRNVNRMLVDGVNCRAAEITRQQDRSLALLGSLREARTKIKNQKQSLAEMNSAHDKALDRIEELEEAKRILNDRNRELTSDANLALTYEAQLAQAKKEMAKAGDLIGALRKENAELKEAKHPRIGLDGDIHDYYDREVKENGKLREKLNDARADFVKKNREIKKLEAKVGQSRTQLWSIRKTLTETVVENLDHVAEGLGNADN